LAFFDENPPNRERDFLESIKFDVPDDFATTDVLFSSSS
jgi:hypothetical protein